MSHSVLARDAELSAATSRSPLYEASSHPCHLQEVHNPRLSGPGGSLHDAFLISDGECDGDDGRSDEAEEPPTPPRNKAHLHSSTASAYPTFPSLRKVMLTGVQKKMGMLLLARRSQPQNPTVHSSAPGFLVKRVSGAPGTQPSLPGTSAHESAPAEIPSTTHAIPRATLLRRSRNRQLLLSVLRVSRVQHLFQTLSQITRQLARCRSRQGFNIRPTQPVS